MDQIGPDTGHGSMQERFLAIARRCLEHRHMPAIMAALAALIMLPALNAGLIQDDLFHRVRLVKPSQLPEQLHSTPLICDDAGTMSAAMRDMHSFARTRQDTEKLIDSGMCPWWTADGWRFANWRPLDSFTHWLDYRLFAKSPPLMHTHNIIWFAALVFLLALLYRQMIAPTWVAALAALLYTIDDSNYFPAMWVANRNLLLALFFAILTLLLHHKWRARNSLASGVAAPLALLLSLLSTEAGIATLAYLLAYALFIEHDSKIRRIASLVPSLIVVVGWRIIYNSLGYGACGSGFVVDPGREPMRYMQAVFERGPILLAGQWGATPAEMLDALSGHAGAWYLFIAVVFLALLLAALIPLLRSSRVALYWFSGMLLCVLPICATRAMNRNLLFVGIGAFGLMAQFITGLLTKQAWTARSRLWRVLAWMLCIALIFIHACFTIVSRAKAPKTMSFVFDTFYSTVKVDPSVDLTDKTLVVVNAPNPFLFIGLPVLRAYWDEPLPDRTRLLAPGFGPLKITRTSEKTLLVEAQTGNILSTDTSRKDFAPNFAYFYHHFNSLFRPEDLPFSVGEQTQLLDMSAEVVAVDSNGQPTKVLFRFAVSLDDPALIWFKWTWKENGLGAYSRFEVPAIGQVVQKEGPFGET